MFNKVVKYCKAFQLNNYKHNMMKPTKLREKHLHDVGSTYIF